MLKLILLSLLSFFVLNFNENIEEVEYENIFFLFKTILKMILQN